jgi:hypothetical protein
MRNFLCALFGHKYKTKKRITNQIAELKCTRCKSEFAINTRMRTLLPLDNELEQMHNEILASRSRLEHRH